MKFIKFKRKIPNTDHQIQNAVFDNVCEYSTEYASIVQPINEILVHLYIFR